MKSRPELSASIAQLKSEWNDFSDVDRAKALERLRDAGASIRSIARELHFSESNLRHLLKIRSAPREDLELAQHG